MVDIPLIRIGTRGSPLARIQAYEIRDRLQAVYPELCYKKAIEIVVIKTTGDTIHDQKLTEIGGKGLFTKEIDEAQRDGRIDIAVHSMKDMPTQLPDGLVLSCVPPREDVRDAFISSKAKNLAELSPGSVIGSASLRRRTQILYRRPDLKVKAFRGNIQTRLQTLAAGKVDAVLLAKAGLNRLGLADMVTTVIEIDEILPAVAQGAIGVTCRAGDDRARAYLDALNDPPSFNRVIAERAFLEALNGSCRMPIAALAVIKDNNILFLRGLIARPDGSTILETKIHGAVSEARALGLNAGAELKGRAGPDFFSNIF